MRGGIHGTKEVKSTRRRGENRALSGIRRAEGTNYPTDRLWPSIPEDVVASLLEDILGPAVPIGHYGPGGVGEVFQGEVDSRVRRGAIDEFSLEASVILANVSWWELEGKVEAQLTPVGPDATSEGVTEVRRQIPNDIVRLP
eukprot:6279481-Alexandrium_andersonii.AAC.1